MTRARARARTGGQPPLTPSWTVTPENLPPGYVYSGGLRTQVNQDGSIGWAPHNLVRHSEALSSTAWQKVAGATHLSDTEASFPATGAVMLQTVTTDAPVGQTFTVSIELSGSGTATLLGARLGPSTYEDAMVQVTLTPTPTRYSVTRTVANAGATGWQIGVTRSAASGDTATVVTMSKAIICYGSVVQPYLVTGAVAPRFEPRTADYSDSMVAAFGSESAIGAWATAPAYDNQTTGSGPTVSASPGSTPNRSALVLTGIQAGKLYEVRATCVSASATVSMFVREGGSIGAGTVLYSSPGLGSGSVVATQFVATQSAANLLFATNVVGSYSFSGVSVREITGAVGTTRRIKIEPAAATNLVPNGNTPETWAGNSPPGGGVIKEVSTANRPGDGLGTVLLRAGSSSLPHFLSTTTFPVTAGQVYTLSALVKEGGSRFAQMIAATNAFGGNVWATFDVRTGEIGASGGLTTIHKPVRLAGGWWLISISGTTLATTTCAVIVAVVQGIGSGRAGAFAGATESIHVGPAQCELGGAPTSLIPTYGAAVTRAADVLYWPLGTIPGWSTDQGTLVTDAVYGGPLSTVPSVVRIGVTGFGINAGTGASLWYNGSTNLSATNAPIVAGERVREAASWSGTRRAISSKGSAATSDNAGAFLAAPSPATLTLGGVGAGSQSINGSIGRVDFYPRPATDSQLQRLSAPV